jgi:hypothetical protein
MVDLLDVKEMEEIEIEQNPLGHDEGTTTNNRPWPFLPHMTTQRANSTTHPIAEREFGVWLWASQAAGSNLAPYTQL